MVRREVESAKPQNQLRILVFSRHQPILDLVTLALTPETYWLRAAVNVAKATELLREWDPQLAVIDFDDGDQQILTRLGLWRDTDRTRIPVLALVKSNDISTRLAAFAQGVDAVIAIPFSDEELRARTQVVARRSLGTVAPLNPVLKLDYFEVNVLRRQIFSGALELHLSGIERGLLCLLAAHAGEVVTHDQILDTLWGSDYSPDSNVVGRLIYRLRGKLQQDGRQSQSIVTVPGRGYLLASEALQIGMAQPRSVAFAPSPTLQLSRV